jgi:dTDP-4-amino-4,6-dideoxygalactose transaminase
MTSDTQVPFFSLRDFPAGIEQEIKVGLLDGVASRHYILGEQVKAFEETFAQALNAGYVIGVGNGFDALTIALKAAGIGAGDEVILPGNTFIATANAVIMVGATPVFAEPDFYTYNITAPAIAAKITSRTKAVIPVHLYGQCCAMDAIMAIAEDAGIKVIEDAAQAHGAAYQGRKAGTFGYANAFSFYPTKNLGAMGDAGAIVTNTPAVAEFVRKYRSYGEVLKNRSEFIGVNSRLDTLQAVILNIKLQHLQLFNAERLRLASTYHTELYDVGDLVLPYIGAMSTHVYHIFNIRTKHRDKLQEHLKKQGIQTAIHYPIPVHLQQAYKFLNLKGGDLPVTEELASTSLSLPLFPGLTEDEQNKVISAVKIYFS